MNINDIKNTTLKELVGEYICDGIQRYKHYYEEGKNDPNSQVAINMYKVLKHKYQELCECISMTLNEELDADFKKYVIESEAFKDYMKDHGVKID